MDSEFTKTYDLILMTSTVIGCYALPLLEIDSDEFVDAPITNLLVVAFKGTIQAIGGVCVAELLPPVVDLIVPFSIAYACQRRYLERE